MFAQIRWLLTEVAVSEAKTRAEGPVLRDGGVESVESCEYPARKRIRNTKLLQSPGKAWRRQSRRQVEEDKPASQRVM